MRVTVELTFADFDEASSAVRGLFQETQQRQARRSPWGVAFVVAVGFITFLFTLFGRGVRFDPAPELRPPMYLAIVIFVPIAALIAFAVVAGLAQRWASRSQRLGAAAKIGLPSLLLLAAVLFLLWLSHFLSRTASALPGTPGTPIQMRPVSRDPDWYGTLLPHAPWIVMMAVLSLLTVRGVRTQSRQAWSAQEQTLSRPKLFDLSVYGVTVDEQVTQRQYQWAGFARYLETPNLLILCPNDLTFEVLPKRCFASRDEIDAARALMRGQIRDPKVAQSAFPVATAAQIPPPLPPPV